MRKSKFSDEEIGIALGKLEKGDSIEDISKKMGVTVATVYNWKKRLDSNSNSSHTVSPPSKTMSLEEENMKLKQLIGNLMLEKQDLLELLNKRSKG